MRVKIRYFVILSVDIYQSEYPATLAEAKPKIVRFPKFKMTENCVEDPEYILKHRKYCGFLTPQEADEFLSENFTDTCQTLGSISEYGWLPAISFSDGDCGQGFYLNAYITPMLDEKDEEEILSEMRDHPNAEQIRRRVGDKLNQCLNLLENFFVREKVGKSFFVDTHQLWLEGIQ